MPRNARRAAHEGKGTRRQRKATKAARRGRLKTADKVALAAICLTRFGRSRLAEIIRKGVGPHCYTADRHRLPEDL